MRRAGIDMTRHLQGASPRRSPNFAAGPRFQVSIRASRLPSPV